MIVLDASALVDWLLGNRRGTEVDRRLEDPRRTLHAPHLIDLEVAQTLRRLLAAGQLSTERAETALAHLALLDLERHGHEELLPRVWQLREGLTAYDAAYLALAEALDAPLVTCDGKLARSPLAGDRVDWIE